MLDISTDPAFFKRQKLLEAGADQVWAEKLGLALEFGLISDDEYDACFNPEAYGLKV